MSAASREDSPVPSPSGVPASAVRRIQAGATLTREFAIRAESIDAGARTVELAFSSETPVERWGAKEILSHEAGCARLDCIRGSGPLLLDHNPRDQIGVVDDVRIDPGRVGRATVRFSKSARAQDVFQDVVDGIRKNVSVGYRIHSVIPVQDSAGRVVPDQYRVVDWEPTEVSIVSIPADASVGVGCAAPEPHPPLNLINFWSNA